MKPNSRSPNRIGTSAKERQPQEWQALDEDSAPGRAWLTCIMLAAIKKQNTAQPAKTFERQWTKNDSVKGAPAF
mgnify:CR=1 FL=1